MEPSKVETPSLRRAGGSDIHPRVREEMRRVLFDTGIPRYLDPTPPSCCDARAAARRQVWQSGCSSLWAVILSGSLGRQPFSAWRAYVGSPGWRCAKMICAHLAKADEAAVRGALASLLLRHPSVLELATTFPVKAQGSMTVSSARSCKRASLPTTPSTWKEPSRRFASRYEEDRRVADQWEKEP